MYNEPKRLEFLDSIRGLAALAVLLSHCFPFQLPPSVNNVVQSPFFNIPFNGKEAVAMFFVLSGFVLSRPYFISNEPGQAPRKMYLPTFYLRRITRIWFPWLFAFGLSALAQFFFFREWPTTPPTTGSFHGFWQTPLTGHGFLRQCLFIEHNARIQLLPQDWSLGLELKASVFLPLLVLLCVTESWWLLLAVSVFLFVVFSMGHCYVSFVLGVLLAKWGRTGVAWLKPKPAHIKIALLFLGILFYGCFHLGHDVLNFNGGEKYFWLATAFGCTLIIFVSLASRRLQAALHLPPIVFLGRISYSVYLLQFVVILCLLPVWIYFLNALGIHQMRWIIPLNLLAAVAATLILSLFSYYLVELPCIKLGHTLSRKLQAAFGRK